MRERIDGALDLALFFSFGMSLGGWREAGLIRRETAYLEVLAQAAGSVVLVTYGRADDERRELKALGDGFDGARFTVVAKKRALPDLVFSVLSPFLLRRGRPAPDLVRSNQISGAWAPLLAKLLLRVPFVLRCGYVRSRFYELGGMPHWRIVLAKQLERLLVRQADLVLTATRRDMEILQELAGIPPERFRLHPNPIDTELFRPPPARSPWRGRVLYVGRLTAQKNLPALIGAARRLEGVSLQLVGDGPCRDELRRLASGDRVQFVGIVPNTEVPERMRDCDVFVLPSRYEGNPKSLLEAMACGCAVVGADVPGIRDVVEHESNGLLCDGTVEGVASAVARFRHSAGLRESCGRRARQTVLEHYEIRMLAEREARLLRSLVGAGGRSGS